MLLQCLKAEAFSLSSPAAALPQGSSPRRRSTALQARTAEGMSKGWRAYKLEADAVLPARVELAPATSDWETKLIEVEIPRSAESPGLGVLLEEFGATGDGTGLVLVGGLVEGGNAYNANVDVLPGDTIVFAGDAKTEARDYDLTIDALMSLPPAPAPAKLTVKRLVKVPVVNCKVMFPPEEERDDVTIRLDPRRDIRFSLIKNKIEMGNCNEDMQCLCNCGMLVRKGMSLIKPMETQEAQMLKKEPYWRLTCRACILPIEEDQDMVIRIRPDLDNIMRPKDPNAWRT